MYRFLLSENGKNSFTSLDLFEIKKNIDWSQFLLLICSTDHVYIRNFDMGKDKVKVHSTKQLRPFRDGQLLNHTVLALQRQFISTWCIFHLK